MYESCNCPLVISVVLPYGEYGPRSNIGNDVAVFWSNGWLHKEVSSIERRVGNFCMMSDKYMTLIVIELTLWVNIDLYFWPLTHWTRVFQVFQTCAIFYPQQYTHTQTHTHTHTDTHTYTHTHIYIYMDKF